MGGKVCGGPRATLLQIKNSSDLGHYFLGEAPFYGRKKNGPQKSLLVLTTGLHRPSRMEVSFRQKEDLFRSEKAICRLESALLRPMQRTFKPRQEPFGPKKEGSFKPIQTQGLIRPMEDTSRQKEGLCQLDRALCWLERALYG